MSKIDDQKSAPVLKPRKFSLGRWLRNNFVAGIVVVAPIAITVTLLWWFVTFVDSKIKPVIQPVVQNIFGPLFPERVDVFEYVLLAIPGIGVLIAVVALIFFGRLATTLLGRTLWSTGERIIDQVPYVRSVYGAVRQLFDAIALSNEGHFEEVVLVEYPRRGIYAIGFKTATAKGEVANYIGQDHIAVFVPTTPNPTSGFLLYFPRDEVTKLDLTLEEGAKLIISAGIVADPRELQAMTKTSGGKSAGNKKNAETMKKTTKEPPKS